LTRSLQSGRSRLERDEQRLRARTALDAAVAEGIDPAALLYVLKIGLETGYFRKTARVLPLRKPGVKPDGSAGDPGEKSPDMKS
jgi:hypothetical protein